MKKKSNKKNRLGKIIFLFVIFILLISITNFILVVSNLPLNTKKLDVTFEIGEIFGIDVSNDSLAFGILVPGYSMERRVQISNNYNFPIIVEISFSKNIEQFLSSPEIILLNVSESSEIPIYLRVPSNETFAKYSGKAMFKIREYKG